MKHDKQDYTIAAIYKLLKRGLYSKEKAITALKTRAGIRNAENTVSLWLRHWI